MWVCIVCKYDELVLDDIVLRRYDSRNGTTQCVCLRCFTRETGTMKVMSYRLRMEITRVLLQEMP